MLSGSAGDDVPSGQSYEELYVEHAPAARRLARSLVPPDVAEDIVAEAFTRVLGAIRAGGGPSAAFRGYLFTAVRNLANDWLRSTRRVAAVGDLEAGHWSAERSGAISHLSSGAESQAEARAEARLVARAFARLPVRWRAVLWQLEVEGNSPAAVAPLFGLSANGVSALAVRAREGLRQAYLQEHIGANIPVPCRAFAEVLGAGARGRLSRRRRAAVHEHLRQCPACTDLFAELSELNRGLGAILAPVLLAGSSASAASGAASVTSAAASAASGKVSAATAIGRHALFRAGLGGPARLWRLHPATGLASVAAGVAAAGGMIFAVSISPAVVSPSPAGPRPALSIAVSGDVTRGGAHGGSPLPGPAAPLARAAQSAAPAVAGCAGNPAPAAAVRGNAGRNGL
ncbi:MAG TPA: sigma-70 family RNA polymerase sigma factor, partial [Streptosporangiaceae bacterium]